MKFRTTSIIIFLTALLLACNRSEKEEVPLDKIDLKLDFSRFDLRLYEASKALQADSSLEDTFVYSHYLKADKSFVVDWFFGGYDSIATDSLASVGFIELFLRDKKVQELLDTIHAHFPENENIERELLDPFKRYTWYFPGRKIPAIRTFVSGYQSSAASGTDEIYLSDKFIGIGLHYFLGEDCPWYPPDLPVYLRKRTDRKYLNITIFRNLADAMINQKKPAAFPPRLLDEMIHAGMRLSFLDKMLPHAPDSLKIYYSKPQWEWAAFYEGRIYKELLPHLYENSHSTLQNYIGESPYTKGLDLESAPRIAEFCGWKIVRAYMKNHPEISLEELLEINDPELILKESRYKPKVQ